MNQERFTLRSAVYLMPLRENEILLLRRFNTGWMDGMYSLISGHLDGGESVSESMIRESLEESGMKIKKEDLIAAHVIHRVSTDSEYIDFFFVVKKWQGEPQIMEPDKCDDLRWFPLDSLPENLLPHVKLAIENYNNKIPFSEFNWEKQS